MSVEQEFKKLNKTFIQQFKHENIPESVLFSCLTESEYQAMAAGWFMAKGLPTPEDCSKETRVK